MYKKIALYVFSLFFIGIWWTIAFLKDSPAPSVCSLHHETPPSPRFSKLPAISRKEFYQALSGNQKSMISLITQWDIEAQILESMGMQGIFRLPHESFLHAHCIEKKIPFQNASKRRFLPQTYAAASFLFALAEPDEIVAIPQGLRKQTKIYPESLTSQIPYNIDETTHEQIYALHPEVAFVASYSHPATVRMLANQGIPICSLRDIMEIQDLPFSLREFGSVIGKNDEAELLAIFIEAAFCAIDNHMQILKETQKLSNIVYLNYHTHYAIPTNKSLTGQMLSRLGVNTMFTKQLLEDGNRHWRLPISLEEIVCINPDIIILSSDYDQKAVHQMMESKALQNIKAVQNKKIYFVDESIQESPSQFLALAYFDLYQTISEAYQK